MDELKKLILKRLSGKIKSFNDGNFKFWIVDDLLPINVATNISKSFPSEELLRKRDSLREYKRVGVDFELYDPLMEKITYVFHDYEIVKRIEEITGFRQMVPDEKLYAGGLSSMNKNSFLNPHLDNSHDDTKSMYRVLNLLYYVSEDWKTANGGNLVLFPKGFHKKSKVITSSFNRLVLMETNDKSYHGVDKVKNKHPRRCISNYYFSLYPTNGKEYQHVTSFFPFPEEESWKGIALAFDRFFRGTLSSIYKKITNHQNWHKRK